MAKRRTVTRMTEDEREASRAQEQAKRVEAFKAHLAARRALRVFDQREAWAVDDRKINVLAELVADYERQTETLRSKCDAIARRMADALARIERNEHASWYSNLIGSDADDAEQESSKRQTNAKAAAMLGYALGYYVPQVESVAGREQHALLVEVDVCETAAGQEWTLSRTAADGTLQFFDGESRTFVSDGWTFYATEGLAYTALMTLCGWYR